MVIKINNAISRVTMLFILTIFISFLCILATEIFQFGSYRRIVANLMMVIALSLWFSTRDRADKIFSIVNLIAFGLFVLLGSIITVAALFLVDSNPTMAVAMGLPIERIGFYPLGADAWFPTGLVIWATTVMLLCLTSAMLGNVFRNWKGVLPQR